MPKKVYNEKSRIPVRLAGRSVCTPGKKVEKGVAGMARIGETGERLSGPQHSASALVTNHVPAIITSRAAINQGVGISRKRISDNVTPMKGATA